MIVYHPVTRDRTTYTFCQPGRKHPVSDWLDDSGEPLSFNVKFEYGKAEVPDNLGRFLIDQGLAQESVILVA